MKKLNGKKIEEKLRNAHQKEADKRGIKIYNFGWVETDFAIGSKTSKGYFESQIDPNTMKITHLLED